MNLKFEIPTAAAAWLKASRSYLKLDWKALLFLIAFALGIFLRVYHFGDWLYFKQDQARDAFISLRAYQQGIGYLPLLGARAGGTSLLLGPIYYYFQYIALLITRNIYPTTFALPDLFFGILAIPMFYIFLKRYFSRNWTIYLASAFALCFFAIEYSRFSWNCNPLPFFTLLYFFALLRLLGDDREKPILWSLIAGLSLAVCTQLHFVAFLGLPVITILLLIFEWKNTKKKINLKTLIAYLSGFLVLYIPWLLNDIQTNGKNTQDFWVAVITKVFAATLWQDVLMGLEYFAHHWLVILTGFVSTDRQLPETLWIWPLFILPIAYLNWKLFRREKMLGKKRFLLLILLWFWIFVIVYIPIGNQLRARYFTVTLELPLIYLGFALVYLGNLGNPGKIAAGIIATAVIVGNLTGTFLWFNQQKMAEQKKSVDYHRTFIFNSEDGIILWNTDQAAKYIAKNCDGKKVLFTAPPVHLKPMVYLLRYYGINNASVRDTSPNLICYWAIGSSKSDLSQVDNYMVDNYHVVGRAKFGLVGVYKIEPNEQSTESKDFYDTTSNEITQETKAIRLFWKDSMYVNKK